MKSNNQCFVGSWVFATIKTTEAFSGGSAGDPPPGVGQTICGRIVKLLAQTEHSVNGIAVIKVYQILDTRHPIFGIPRLTNAIANGESPVIVPAEVRSLYQCSRGFN